MRRFPALFALLLVAILAACGGSGSGDATGNTTDNSTGTESSAPTTPTDTTGGMTDDLYGSPEMAALLPTSVDGVAFEISTFDYSKVPLEQAAMSFGDASLDGWLGETGKTWADVRWGMAITDLTGDKTATISAMRVIGADPTRLLEWWGGSSLSTNMDGAQEVTLGGKSVTKTIVPGLDTVFYQWTQGDTLYWVVSAPEAFGDAVVGATK